MSLEDNTVDKLDLSFAQKTVKRRYALCQADRADITELYIDCGNRVKVSILRCLRRAYPDRPLTIRDCWSDVNPSYAKPGDEGATLILESRNLYALISAVRNQDCIEISGRDIRVRFPVQGETKYLEMEVLNETPQLSHVLYPAARLLELIREVVCQ